MSDKLSIQGTSKNGVLLVKLNGVLDGHTYMELEAYLKAQVGANINRFVIVLKDISYIASAGVGVLISFMKQCSGADGKLEVAEPSTSVSEVLEILGLDALMTLHKTIDGALEAARG